MPKAVIFDSNGNIIGLIDNNGNVVVEYKYDAWGDHVIVLSDSSNENLAKANPFRYRGYYYDEETGLYYLKSRYYDPETGRFLNADDISYLDPETINGLNLYAYCGNNPVMRVDANGNAWWEFWKWDWAKIGGWILVGTMAIAGTALVIAGTFFTAGLAGAVMAGIGLGALSGITYSINQQGGFNNIANINPLKVAGAGFIGAAIGAATGAFSYGVSVAGEIVGNAIGITLGNSTFLGLKVSKVVDSLLIANIGKVSGRVLSGIVADVFTSYALNKIFGLTFEDDYFAELLGTQGLSWLSQFIQYMIKL